MVRTLPPTATTDVPAGLLDVRPWSRPDRDDYLAVVATPGAAKKLHRTSLLPLGAVGGTSRAEFWLARGPLQRVENDGAKLAYDGTVLFGCLIVDEAAAPLEDVTERAYKAMLKHNAAHGFPHLQRIWQYFGAINEGDGDAERYRRFCVGRGRLALLEPGTIHAAATAIGIPAAPRRFYLHWLAAKQPGVALDNPRQTKPTQYPREYGPVPPGFARAVLLDWSDPPLLLVSGTASIVGHESTHDTVIAQLDETLGHLQALIDDAGKRLGRDGKLGPNTLLRVYVRRPEDAARVAVRLLGALGAQVPFLLLHGDVCRKDLFVEVEAVHRFV
jgi:chorismate lyase/3-hydroxybenzoate synthase